jgi:hypothetical protein
MKKLLTAAAALALMATAAQADCYGGHDVTASAEKPQEGVAMSTYDGTTAPPVATDEAKPAKASTTACEPGDEGCAAEDK